MDVVVRIVGRVIYLNAVGQDSVTDTAGEQTSALVVENNAVIDNFHEL